MEYFYYWGFITWICFSIVSKEYLVINKLYVLFFSIFWILSEYGNWKCHVILANLRSDGSEAKKVPHGFAFEYITCPNYSFEILAWFAFAMLAKTLSGKVSVLIRVFN